MICTSPSILCSLSLDSKVAIISATITVLAACISAGVTIYIATRYSRLKLYATASIEDSDNAIKFENGTAGKMSPSGLCIEIVNDGLCKIKTYFLIEYGFRRLFQYKSLWYTDLCAEGQIINSGDKARQDINMQQADGLILHVLSSGGRGRLRIEYAQLGSTKHKYTDIDMFPIVNGFTVSNILSAFHREAYYLGDIGGLVAKLKSAFFVENANSIEKNELDGDTYSILFQLFYSFNVARQMTKSLYEYMDYNICSATLFFGCPSGDGFNCTLRKYKSCAKRLCQALNRHGFSSTASINKYFTNGKINKGIDASIKNALQEWEQWHDVVGVRFK